MTVVMVKQGGGASEPPKEPDEEKPEGDQPDEGSGDEEKGAD